MARQRKSDPRTQDALRFVVSDRILDRLRELSKERDIGWPAKTYTFSIELSRPERGPKDMDRLVYTAMTFGGLALTAGGIAAQVIPHGLSDVEEPGATPMMFGGLAIALAGAQLDRSKPFAKRNERLGREVAKRLDSEINKALSSQHLPRIDADWSNVPDDVVMEASAYFSEERAIASESFPGFHSINQIYGVAADSLWAEVRSGPESGPSFA